MAVIPYAATKRSALKREGDTALCDPGDRQGPWVSSPEIHVPRPSTMSSFWIHVLKL